MTRRSNRRNSEDANLTVGGWLFKFGTKLLLTAVVVVVALSLLQCTVKKPESPTWDTQLTLPLLNRTYPMSEIVDKMDQDGITIDSNSNVVFSINRDIDTVRLDADAMTTADLSYSLIQSLGQIDIPAPSIAPIVLDITQVAGLATFVPGAIPATSFSITNSIPAISTWTSAGVSSGEAYVIVANNLGFAITADAVELWDIGYNRSIGSQAFPNPIPDGGVDSVLYDLSGTTISNQIQARITASTAGGLVLSTSGKTISTALRFTRDLTVGAATAEIPAVNLDFSDVLPLSESDAIYRATLSSGALQMSIANQTNVTTDFDITFPDLRQNGIPLTLQRSVGPISSGSVNLDLSGYVLAPVDSTLPQEIQVLVAASVPASAPQQVTFDQSQEFIVSAGLSNLAFDTVTGVFASVGTTLAPSEHAIDVPDGFDSAQLVTAVLTLEIENGVQMAGQLDLTLLGSNGKTLNIVGTVDPATPSASVITQIVDTTVADFLSPMPSLITISGSTTFGDGVSEGSIRNGDFVHASVKIETPLELILPRTVIAPDIESEHINQDDFDPVTDHVIEARLVYNVINRLPIGATVNIYLSSDSATVVSNPEVSFIDEIFVVAAPTVGGIASDTISTGYQTVVVDSLDVNILKNDTLYIATEIILEDTNGQPIKLTASDYLTLIGRLEVDYHFDGKF